jgi:protein-disulfide isomerase
MAQHPGKVRYVVKDYPLDPECNAAVPRGGHLMSCEAAVATRMAYDKGRAQGEKVEDWLFANQQTLTRENIAQQVREAGGVTDFDARYARYLEQVKMDTGMGGLLGIRSTPTFFINGVRIEGGMQPPFFDAILAHELKKAGR